MKIIVEGEKSASCYGGTTAPPTLRINTSSYILRFATEVLHDGR